MRLKEYSLANEKLKESLQIQRQIGHLRGEGLVLFNLAVLYQLLKDPDEALKYYTDARQVFGNLYIPSKIAALTNFPFEKTDGIFIGEVHPNTII